MTSTAPGFVTAAHHRHYLELSAYERAVRLELAARLRFAAAMRCDAAEVTRWQRYTDRLTATRPGWNYP